MNRDERVRLLGLCWRCKKEPKAEGRAACLECMRKDRLRKRRKALGVDTLEDEFRETPGESFGRWRRILPRSSENEGKAKPFVNLIDLAVERAKTDGPCLCPGLFCEHPSRECGTLEVLPRLFGPPACLECHRRTVAGFRARYEAERAGKANP